MTTKLNQKMKNDHKHDICTANSTKGVLGTKQDSIYITVTLPTHENAYPQDSRD